MFRKVSIILLLVALSLAAAFPAFADGPHPSRNAADEVVYVTSLGLYFDTNINSAMNLPPKGPFQQLYMPGQNPDHPELTTLSTEFGPGAPGHYGGRWWIDLNGNDIMDEGDAFFSCPLLGPGRSAAE